jgi:hypothetical protein
MEGWRWLLSGPLVLWVKAPQDLRAYLEGVLGHETSLSQLVTAICGAERSRSKECSIGNVKVGVYEIHGTHASSRNANDTWAGIRKKEHLTALVTREDSYRIDQNKRLCRFDSKTYND